MKRFFILILALLLTVCTFACGGAQKGTETTPEQPAPGTEATPDPPAEASAAPTEEPAPTFTAGTYGIGSRPRT